MDYGNNIDADYMNNTNMAIPFLYLLTRLQFIWQLKCHSIIGNPMFSWKDRHSVNIIHW